MAVEVIMPKLGMSMEEGTVVLWHKQKGDSVKKGDSVVSISSEKIENEVEAPVDGVLLEILAEVDTVVPVGKAIGYIGKPGERLPDQEEVAATAEAEVSPKTFTMNVSKDTEGEKKHPPAGSGMKRKRISPAARQLAKVEGIDVETIEGTGPLGRVTKEDVKKALERFDAEQSPKVEIKPERTQAQKVKETKEAVTVRDFSGIRKVIGSRMHESMQNTAQLTMMRNADVTELMAFRKRLNSSLDDVNGEQRKITVTDLLAKAVTFALQKHPNMNSALIENKIYEYHSVHLGIAAATERGLVVPVIKDAHQKSLIAMSNEIQRLGQKAKDGQLTSDEMKGSTFTITNLGASQISFFTPVLNPPETGILGVGLIEELAVFDNGQVVPKLKLPLSLTFDHQVIDGEPASQFLNTVIEYLEHPYRLVM